MTRSLKTMHLQQARDDIEALLAGGKGLRQTQIRAELLKLREWGGMGCDALLALVSLALRTYDREFYFDRSTGRWYLTLSARERVSKQGKKRRTGTTGMALAAEAMEERD